MGLSDRVARLAAQRPHVLVVAAPGWDLLRMQLQAAVRRSGWALADSPADTDLLVTAGVPGDELAMLIDRAWEQVPSPRWRLAAVRADSITAMLGEGADALANVALQRRHLAEPAADAPDQDMSGPGHGDMHPDPSADHAMQGMGGMQGMHGMEHGDSVHDGMDMSMSMDGPGGIPLAGGSEDDRDGLEMDVLHLPLGPVLPNWPAGLVLDCTLSGDVVLAASARLLPAAATEPPEEVLPQQQRLALHLDAAAQILHLTGPAATAASAGRLRDDVLTGADVAAVRAGIRALHGRVRRSRLLAWSLGARPTALGPVRDRLTAHLAAAQALAEGAPAVEPDSVDPAVLAEAVQGRGLAEVRLLAAGLSLQSAGSVVRYG